MTIFIRLIDQKEPANKLANVCHDLRVGTGSEFVYKVDSTAFELIPRSPFAYWIPESLLDAFERFPSVADKNTVRSGSVTFDDFRFLRLAFEICPSDQAPPLAGRWQPISKGGAYSRFYSDPHLLVDWQNNGNYVAECVYLHRPREGYGWGDRGRNKDFFGVPSITWSRRSQKGFSSRVLPSGMVFSDKSPVVQNSDYEHLWHFVAISNSRPFKGLLEAQISFGSYEVGAVENTPLPGVPDQSNDNILPGKLARRIWFLMWSVDRAIETSHAFVLPAILLAEGGSISERASAWHANRRAIAAEIRAAQNEIERLAENLYGNAPNTGEADGSVTSQDEVLDEDVLSLDTDHELIHSLLSWTVGVVYGRFDWRIATGAQKMPTVPEPFEPLSPKSPAMLPDDSDPFHNHQGVLVDDPGHGHDLPHLIESVLTQVEIAAPDDLRRWLQRDFFKEHLKQYSKSRRKAPIYWPLSTSSGIYTLWVYYPELDDQTLYTVVNNFIEPKLKSIEDMLNMLRAKTGRTTAEEREFEKQQDLQQELIELRDTILEIAPNYRPNHDDGVQITAAPLWPLFRHKLWQKVLKDTWVKLEAGEYDWAHLACSYWPDRVREKCQTDKSLAIAHGLEELYEEPAA
jgi:hypothetical protein